MPPPALNSVTGTITGVPALTLGGIEPRPTIWMSGGWGVSPVAGAGPDSVGLENRLSAVLLSHASSIPNMAVCSRDLTACPIPPVLLAAPSSLAAASASDACGDWASADSSPDMTRYAV